MRPTRVSFDFLGDHAMYLYDACIYDGPKPCANYIDKLKRLINEIVRNDLTALQRELVIEHYYKSKSMTEIARERGVNKSTVSRNLKKARERVANTLKYSAEHLLRDRLD